jgi:hypothetical protein
VGTVAAPRETPDAVPEPAACVRLDLVRLSDGSYGVMDQRREVGRLIPTKRRWFWAIRWSELQGYAPTRAAALQALAQAWSAALHPGHAGIQEKG